MEAQSVHTTCDSSRKEGRAFKAGHLGGSNCPTRTAVSHGEYPVHGTSPTRQAANACMTHVHHRHALDLAPMALEA
jgi:hypothetical protein